MSCICNMYVLHVCDGRSTRAHSGLSWHAGRGPLSWEGAARTIRRREERDVHLSDAENMPYRDMSAACFGPTLENMQMKLIPKIRNIRLTYAYTPSGDVGLFKETQFDNQTMKDARSSLTQCRRNPGESVAQVQVTGISLSSQAP